MKGFVLVMMLLFLLLLSELVLPLMERVVLQSGRDGHFLGVIHRENGAS